MPTHIRSPPVVNPLAPFLCDQPVVRGTLRRQVLNQRCPQFSISSRSVPKDRAAILDEPSAAGTPSATPGPPRPTHILKALHDPQGPCSPTSGAHRRHQHPSPDEPGKRRGPGDRRLDRSSGRRRSAPTGLSLLMNLTESPDLLILAST